MSELFAIFLGMVLINNFILVRFLGLCPFFGVSKQLNSAISMGIAVTFVMAIASLATWLIRNCILIPLDIEYMHIVIFILVIATLVQIIELFIKKVLHRFIDVNGVSNRRRCLQEHQNLGVDILAFL